MTDISLPAGGVGVLIGMLLWWLSAGPTLLIFLRFLRGPGKRPDTARRVVIAAIITIGLIWLAITGMTIYLVNLNSPHHSGWTWLLSGTALAFVFLVSRSIRGLAGNVWQVERGELVPRAAFALQLTPTIGARRRFARLLQRHLRKQFGATLVVQPLVLGLLYRASALTFQVQGKEISVTLWRNRSALPEHKHNWRLRIDSVERSATMELMVASDHVHAFLASTSGIAALRWYFEGWDPKVPGVASPRELPWRQHLPLLRQQKWGTVTYSGDAPRGV